MSNTLIAIVANDCRGGINPEQTIQERFAAAFKAARNHWMVLDENLQMQGACVAVAESYGLGTDEVKRIRAELDTVRKLNAVISANAAGLTVSLSDAFGDLDEDRPEPIGIMKLWHESA